MSGVKWIKITADIFDNRKIKQIEKLPDGDTLIVIWVKLLCLAGDVNDGGRIYLTEDIPYTAEMLATQLNRPLDTVKHAIRTFQQFGMVEIEDDDIIRISSWDKYQNVEGLDRIKEQTRKRVAKHRVSKTNDTDKKECNVTCNADVTQCNVTRNVTVTLRNATDKEEDIDKDIDIKEKDIKRKDSETVVSYFNETCVSLPRVSKISDVRERAINARLKENGMETVKAVIDKVRDSDFLNGKNDKGWTASIDWIMKPANFQKILEGCYDNRSGTVSRHEVFKGHTQQEYLSDPLGGMPDFDALEAEMQRMNVNNTG